MLSTHGLDTKGTKPVLVTRLKEFLAGQSEGAAVPQETKETEETKEEEAATEEAAPAAVEPMEEEPVAVAPVTPVVEAEVKTEVKAAEAAPVEEKTTEAVADAEPAKEEVKDEVAEAMDSSKAPEAAEAVAAAAPVKTEQQGDNKRGTKRKRDDEPYVITEDEPEIPDNFMCLDWFNSDLTMKINKETFLAAEPYHVAAWGYVFSSAKATHGFSSGKIAYEVKWTGNLEVKLEDVAEPHEIRVGWSTVDSCLQVLTSFTRFVFI